MKDIIDVDVKVRKIDFGKCETDVLAIGMFSDGGGKLDKVCGELDGRLGGAIGRLVKLEDFTGKEASSAVVYGNDNIGARRVLLVGLGEKKKATMNTVRRAAAIAAKKAVSMKAEKLSVGLAKAFGGRKDLAQLGTAIAEGICLGGYRYDEFVTDSENGRLKSLAAEVIDTEAAKVRQLGKGVSAGLIIGRAQSYARTLSNRPGNVIFPASLAAEAKKVAAESKNLSCTVFDEKELISKGMGGILAVGSGSVNKPRFIILKYKASSKKADKLPTIGIVGKAVTFDSGGISIKPSANMHEMKFDKSGGIAVLATMKAVAELGLGINVYGFIPAAENMPSGTSYRPGDIVTTYSGKTVEVQNTDAEGRMILIDGLAYAVERKCDVIIDIATLTGACEVALGRHMAGLMGNDGKLMKQLQEASAQSGEKIWPMPSGDEYLEEMKSKIADLKNIGSRWGGACSAAAFLGQFVGSTKWAHLDMAGVDMFAKTGGFSAVGSRGFGVRLLTRFLMDAAGK